MDLSDPNFLPILQPYEWPGSDQVLCRPLIASSQEGVPWVAFGVDSPETIEYLGLDVAEENGISIEDAEAAAIQNLSARKGEALEWEGFENDGTRLLFRGEDDLSASEILLESELQPLHEMFESEILTAIIPHRFAILIGDATAPLMFIGMGPGMFEEAIEEGQGPVSPVVFAIAEGKIVGICGELQIPVQFIGIGEQVEDLRPFNAAEFVEALFD